MMHPRWLALPLAAVTGCATVSEPLPRLLSPDLHVGSLDQRTRFELDDQGAAATAERDAPDDEPKRRVDTPEKQRRRKALYIAGLVGMGVGVGGLVAFGVGGRIVQAQLRNGYDDGDLMREREEQLQTTGKVMNGLTIGTAIVGILGLVTAATVYGIDHARCGELRPRRKDCRPEHEANAGDEAPADTEAAPSTASDAAAPSDATAAPGDATSAETEAGPAETEVGPAEAEVGPAPASPPPAGASPAPASPPAPKPGAAATPAGKPSPGAAAGR